MKNLYFGILLLVALAPAAFAQTWCEEDCCGDAGGTWDSTYETCSNPDSTYYTCLSDWCTGDSGSSSTTPSFNYSCCGSAFILASIGAGAAFIAHKR